MTLEQAFEQLSNSEEFKEISRQKTSEGGKYRSYLSLYQKGELKSGALVGILLNHGYTITANKAVKRKVKKR